MKTIRTHLTFTFDETKVTEQDIKDRLDAMLCNEFEDVDDVHTRWAEKLPDSPLSDSPLSGAAKE